MKMLGCLKRKLKFGTRRKLRENKFKVGDQVLLYNSRLHDDMKGKPHVVNGQRLKHYIAGKSFIGMVEKLNLQTPKEVIERNVAVLETLNQ